MSSIVIAQSGELYEGMLKDLAEGRKALKEANANIDNMIKTNLKMSVEYQGCIAANRELRKENLRQQNIITTMKGYACERLGMFEIIFDTNEGIISREDLIKYITVAEYMQERYNRKSKFLKLVKERLAAAR